MRDPHSRDAGSIPARVTYHSQVVELGYTRRSERRALCGMGVRISPWLLTRVSQRSAGPHKPGPSGATPEPAMTRYANWQSDEVESLVFVGSTPTLVTLDRVVQRLRRLVDIQESDGSTPSAITSRDLVCKCFGRTRPW